MFIDTCNLSRGNGLQICKMENEKKCMEEALASLNIRRKNRKIILLKGKTGESRYRVDFG